MADYQAIPRQRVRRPALFSAEGAQWRLYRRPLTLPLKAAPTHLEFSPVAPYDVAVASSLQVDIFSTQTNAVYRTLSRFKDIVHCASYRYDGKVLAAGDERGQTQLFDLSSRAVMRTFHGHESAVHVARFSRESTQLFTASDDHRALCWDVQAESQIRAFDGHSDFIRSGALNPASSHMFVTGSYDHTVRLWDVNSPNCVMTLKHAAPVEDLVLLPGGGVLASASGNTLTLWDILSGGRVLHSVSAHSKTITALSTDHEGRHILSASLDRMVKVYELGSCKAVGSIKYAAPLLTLALSPSGTHLVVGQSDSSLCVRRQRSQPTRHGAQSPSDPLALQSVGRPGQVARQEGGKMESARPGTYRYFLRGRKHAAQPSDLVLEASSSLKLNSFDKALKSFNYHEAFDAALKVRSQLIIIHSLKRFGCVLHRLFLGVGWEPRGGCLGGGGTCAAQWAQDCPAGARSTESATRGCFPCSAGRSRLL